MGKNDVIFRAQVEDWGDKRMYNIFSLKMFNVNMTCGNACTKALEEIVIPLENIVMFYQTS